MFYELPKPPYKSLDYAAGGLLTIEYFDGSKIQWSKVPENLVDELRKNYSKVDFMTKHIISRYRITRLN